MATLIDQGRIDPSNIVDIDLGGEILRQGAMRGICAQWGARKPFYVINYGLTHVVVGRHADAYEVFTDPIRFSVELPKKPGFERFDFFQGLSNIAQVDGGDHDRVRKALMPSFSPAGINRLNDAVSAIIDKMLDEVEALGGPFDCINDFATHLINRIVLDGLLGLSSSQQEAFGRLHHAYALVVDLPPEAERPAEFIAAFNDVVQAIYDIVEARRAMPRKNDFVSTLVQTLDATHDLSMEELIGNTLTILSAGQGTTAIATTAMLVNLCKNPEQFAQVRADPKLIPQTVEESLRYQGPGLFAFARVATQDTSVGGTPIYKGMPVLVSMQSANYDPIAYPNPLKFDIHRNPRNVMTFGAGPHHCLGNRLARRVMALVLEKVCVRFPNLHLPDPAFEPVYEGMFGEMRMSAWPMHTGK